jgi:ribosomal-protein-alanine N-acetyltransferase
MYTEPAAFASATPAATPTGTWQDGLPTLTGARLTLRELTLADAPALLSLLTTDEVARFISEPPTNVEGFERFIRWTHRERQAGRHVCFAVVPTGMMTPIGIFQVRQLEAGFATGEWGFAIGSPFWGAGFFVEAARLVVDFAVETIGVHRLEARAAVVNGRGNGALRKVGAVQEGVLRRAFRKDGRQMDQALWSIVADEWRQARAVWARVLVH